MPSPPPRAGRDRALLSVADRDRCTERERFHDRTRHRLRKRDALSAVQLHGSKSDTCRDLVHLVDALVGEHTDGQRTLGFEVARDDLRAAVTKVLGARGQAGSADSIPGNGATA